MLSLKNSKISIKSSMEINKQNLGYRGTSQVSYHRQIFTNKGM